jgi:hypothetical protein
VIYGDDQEREHLEPVAETAVNEHGELQKLHLAHMHCASEWTDGQLTGTVGKQSNTHARTASASIAMIHSNSDGPCSHVLLQSRAR